MAGPGRLDDGSQTRRGLATLDLEVEALAGVERNVPYGVGPADVPDANLVDTRPDCSCRTGEADDPTRSNPATADGVGARGAGRADEPNPRLPAGDHAAGNERGRRGGGNAERAQGGRGTGRRYAGGIPRLHPDLGAALGEQVSRGAVRQAAIAIAVTEPRMRIAVQRRSTVSRIAGVVGGRGDQRHGNAGCSLTPKFARQLQRYVRLPRYSPGNIGNSGPRAWATLD